MTPFFDLVSRTYTLDVDGRCQLNRKMTLSSLEVEAKSIAATLHRLTALVYDYDRRKGLSQAWFRELDSRHDLWKDLSEEWENSVRGSLAILSVFGPGTAAAAFVRSVGDHLPDEELALVRLWRAQPWHLVAFRVKETLGSGFVQVEPLGSRPSTWPAGSPWEEFRLFSPNISSRPETHGAPMVTLLWPQRNGWQTYGPILNFPGWTEGDFAYLTAVALQTGQKGPLALKGIWPTGRSLAAELTRRPVLGFLLTLWSEDPVMMGPLGPSRFHISLAPVLDAAMTEEAWWNSQARTHAEEVGTLSRLDGVTEVYLGDGSAMSNPWFLVSHHDQMVYLGAMSFAGYLRGRNFLDGVAAFPEQPLVEVSTTTWVASQTLWPTMEDTYDRLTRQVEVSQGSSSADSIEAQRNMQEIQRVVDRLVGNYNEGHQESAKATAAALGVEESLVVQLAKSLSKSIPASAPTKEVLVLPPRVLRELMVAGIPNAEGFFVQNQEPVPLELIEKVPLVRLFRRLTDVAALAGGRIPATASGYLDPRLVSELWQAFRAFDPASRWTGQPRREADWFWLIRGRRQLEGAGLLGLDKRGFFLTDRARKLLDQPRALYEGFLNYGLHTAVWGDPERIGTFQAGLRQCHGLLIYALGALSARAKNKGKWVDSKLLAKVWLDRFPLPEHSESARDLVFIETIFKKLVVDGLFHCLGLGEIHPQDRGDWGGDQKVRPTALYQALFTIPAPK